MPSDYTWKERKFLENDFRYSWDIVWYGQVYPGTHNIQLGNSQLSKKEWLYSRRNGWNGRTRYDRDVGGDFNKLTWQQSHLPAALDTTAGMYHYYGSLLAWPTPIDGLISQSSFSGLIPSDNELATAGTRLISQASPVAPQAGLSTALVELRREGLPRFTSDAVSSLWRGKKIGSFAGAGSDFLNWQFGWLPIVSDVKKLAKSVMQTDQLLSQLYRDNGKLIRRRKGGPSLKVMLDESSVEQEDVGIPILPAYFYPNGMGKLFTTDETFRAQWFSGAFYYHLPEDVGPLSDLRRRAVEARYLYGLCATPIDFWNLVPWSWLSDWFFSTGDVIANFSDQIYTGQVMKYGYVMSHTERHVQHELNVNIGGQNHVAASLDVFDAKVRQKATPFGFGMTWDGFSPKQVSILAALGLSRGS